MPLQEVIEETREHLDRASGGMQVLALHRPEFELLALIRTSAKIAQFSDDLEKLVESEKKTIEKGF